MKLRILDIEKAYRYCSPSEAGLWQAGADTWIGLAVSVEWYLKTVPAGAVTIIK